MKLLADNGNTLRCQSKTREKTTKKELHNETAISHRAERSAHNTAEEKRSESFTLLLLLYKNNKTKVSALLLFVMIK